MTKRKKPTRAQKAEADRNARLADATRKSVEAEEERSRAAQAGRDKQRDDAAKLAENAEREAVKSMEKPMKAEPEKPKPSAFQRLFGR